MSEISIANNSAQVLSIESITALFSSSSLCRQWEENNERNEFDYYGFPPPSIKIRDALDQCPIKVEYFKKQVAKEEKKSIFKDPLLRSLDEYLCELKSKKYHFITDGIETKTDISRLGMSDSQLKKLNRKEREKTKGSKWFNMKKPEMTEELKNDLAVIQMRASLDPKQFYKRNEMKALPKYFEVGKVVDGPIEYHNNKNIRKRNRTLVDELLEDAEFQKFNKRKYQENLKAKATNKYKNAVKKMKKLKKK